MNKTEMWLTDKEIALLEAAPGMYEALKIALLLSEQPILQGSADVQMLTNTIRQVLAKAEGK